MIWPVYVVYVFTVGCIRVYKWIEHQIIKLFFPLFKGMGRRYMESIGVIFHAPGDPEWTQADTERVLAKCPQYDKLVHMKAYNNLIFTKTFNQGTLGFGECYMDGVYDYMNDAEELTEFGRRAMENNLMDIYWNPWNRFLEYLELHAFNLQTRKRAFQVIKEHYNLGDDLFELMLDPYMQYTCGYWARANNLNDAQIDKMHLIAKKLELRPGMRVLDIGCGWGNLCKFLAENYGVQVVGVTIAEGGVAYARNLCKGLNVEIRLCDYRDLNEKFDRICSVGMFEHVGFRNYREYFKVVHRCLKDDGIFLLHCISRNHTNIPRSEPWVHKYIFPNGNLPEPMDIAKNTRGLWVIEDWHNFALDYVKTLEAWRVNFNANWPKLEEKYGPRFYRMWIFYLSFSKALFQSRRLQLWQIVLSKDGLTREYRAPR